MKHPLLQLNAVAALFAAGAAALAQATSIENDTGTSMVVVSATRTGLSGFDLPASVDVIDARASGASQARVNASEALAAVPGLVAQNRQNYAQDLQISSRGFGARAAFGVRGVHLIADGIPASMADGQGQAATFNLDMAERIEVLRGPFSAIYGNHAGGVIQLFSRDGAGPPTLELNASGGSDGARKLDLNAQGKSGGIGYLLDASRFDTDGYRSHSAAQREQSFAKITLAPVDGARLAIIASGLRQHDTQDPLGVSWATLQRDPRAGETDATDPQSPQRTFAERYNTRKSIDHQQIGATWEQRIGADRLRATMYGGNRDVIQYQAFSKAFQTPASHSGGVVDFARQFHGAELNWVHVDTLAGGKLTTSAGIEFARSRDVRQGFENFIGGQVGVKGNLRRDEDDTVSSIDPYLQSEWQAGSWLLSAGLRHSRVRIEVADHFLGNGNDSGSLAYRHTTPVVGIRYQINAHTNLYASAARGFETPTLNELFYSGAGAGFNFRLKPAQSTHLETGIKLRLRDGGSINTALFQVRTRDELATDLASGGRTSYRNAGATLRQGAEMALEAPLAYGLSTRLSLTTLRAVYQEGFGAVRPGSRLPGIPNANLYGELAWKAADERFGAGLEALASGKIYAEDANIEIPAPGYAVLNARINASQSWAGWRFKQYARLNNLLDRQYVGSLIVGDSNKRFYEAAPGRNWLLGASAQYAF
ncbi:TonB-dependent receptor [Oxalobacteraceae bacterium]|nr:TonB-dependent receptor [Oxalobacteraceae bacterium]